MEQMALLRESDPASSEVSTLLQLSRLSNLSATLLHTTPSWDHGGRAVRVHSRHYIKAAQVSSYLKIRASASWLC